MRFILFFTLALLSSSASASWSYYSNAFLCKGQSPSSYMWDENYVFYAGAEQTSSSGCKYIPIYRSPKSGWDLPPNNETVYGSVYTDEQCQAAYGGEMKAVDVPTGSLLSSNAYVNTGACKLYQTPGVTFCTNNKDANGNDTGTEHCSTIWRTESTGEQNAPDTEGATVEESPFQLTDNPSSCANGSYSSGGKSYCYTGQSTDINTIHIGDDGNPVTNDGGTDTGGNTGGGDTGSVSEGGSTGGGSTGGGSTGGGGSSGGGGGASGGGSSGGGSTGGDTSTGGGDTSTDDDTTPTQGDTGSTDGGSSDSGSNDSGDGEESDEPGDGLDAVLDAIGGVRKAINDGFSNLVDKIAGVGDAIDEGNQAAEDRFSAMAESAPTQAELEAEFGSDEDAQSTLDSALKEAGSTLTGYIDGTDSTFSGPFKAMKDLAGSVIPSVPPPSCTPLVFAPGKVYTITIDCEIFELIRSALAWILYVLTAWMIISIMFNSRPA
ncbi:hypothetical protein QO259_12315 [Salinicola sp. JS01]|uniref:hypothetical protein n=1 Tax=Salinicola sp. JS01 TaxID=3050071 RepID=UPI00255BAAA1|nr:hypothetical protein [Salinicola sp. JS01]WIX31601.1 hypothetical protein QO259_12315 [Salinicola sp. JS01]